ncbi:MAG: N,N-diacetylchitobiose transport system substrate-binding protein [Frankiales bacterium]|nr:N,N-diacetylchitobiose transport system substrate-binding protein [Frankiales bacterium]
MKARYVASVGIAVALAATACGSSSSSNSAGGTSTGTTTTAAATTAAATSAATPSTAVATSVAATGAPSGAKCANGKLTVWLMSDAQTGWPDAVKSANDSFAAANPGCTADVQYQSWGTYQDKLTAAINGGQAPDVVEFGNSQTTKWIAGSALSDATAAKATFDNSATWLSGLTTSCTYQGKTWCVPYYAGTRVVIYRKDLFAKAGITAAPTTYNELIADLDKLETKLGSTPNFSAFYVPGKYWYFGTAYAADADPNFQIATQTGSKWTGNFAAQAAALTKWQTLVKKYSKADPNGDEAKQDASMATGNIAAIYGNGWEEGVVSAPKAKGGNPALAKVLGVFPMPSAAKPDSTDVMPSFVGGSDLAVPAKSANQDAAWAWIRAFTGKTAMGMIAKDGAIPNNTAQIDLAKADPAVKTAASRTWFVPIAPNWSNVESGGALQSLFSKIANGSATAATAKTADSAIADTLNAAS